MHRWIFYSLALLCLLPLQSCTTSNSAPDSDKLRIAVIRYQHETCTFCPGGDTEIKDWTQKENTSMVKKSWKQEATSEVLFTLPSYSMKLNWLVSTLLIMFLEALPGAGIAKKALNIS